MESAEKRSQRPKSRQSIAHLPSQVNLITVDKQNTTVDLSALNRKQNTQPLVSKKKSRGKSLGPGGLEALQQTSGNAIKTAATLQVKSILKPTVPLTPPKVIPTFEELRKRSTSKAKSPGKSIAEDLLIDFSTPGPTHEIASNTAGAFTATLLDTFSPVRKDHAQNGQSLNPEQEEAAEKRRQSMKKEILERRDARRKSMANRRVSFAPEATLHTWSVMELVEDSTTSSVSNSTRRQSGMTTAQSPAVGYSFDLSGPPSIPPEQAEEALITTSPAHRRDLHEKRHRRRSGSATNMDEDVYSSSPSGDVVTDSSPVQVEDSIYSESDTDGDTVMSLDEATSNTINTLASGSSTHSSLDERLRQAASSAGTRGIEFDENVDDDLSMEMATGTVTNAFQPWVNGHGYVANDAFLDRENIDPFASAQTTHPAAQTQTNDDNITQGMTMEMTRAIGGILGNDSSPSRSRRKSVASRRRSSVARRRSDGEDSSIGDESMEFTAVGGGILTGARGIRQDEGDEELDNSDAEMTMEFTTAIGGLQNGHSRRESFPSVMEDGNETMDMTVAVGGILEPIEEQTEPQTDIEDDITVPMEMTKAVGQILHQPQSQQNEETSDEQVEVTYPSLPEDAAMAPREQMLSVADAPHQFTSVASETGSPSIALKPRASGRSRSVNQSTTPKSASRETPVKAFNANQAFTPSKQTTAKPARGTTPERTPVAANITHRGASPKRLFQSEIKARASPASIKKSLGKNNHPLFSKDEETGHQTPRVVLHAPKPHQHLRRRSSGVGIDHEGFGSPRVSEILDKRSSIGDTAVEFKLQSPQKSRLSFEDPRQIESEIDAERTEEERRESGRFIMEQEANGQQEENVTLQLKGMIESMTPRKNKPAKTKGRKSLAVGSARGLLGKRPAELDSDAEEHDDHTPKRVKTVSRESSPVKKIHLPMPPSKEETTGRLTRGQQLALESVSNGSHTPDLNLPDKNCGAASPLHAGRFVDVTQNESADKPISFEDRLDNVVGAVDVTTTHPSSQEEEKVSLQDFLNMTNVHFIELSTTKRRHTLAQSMSAQIFDEGIENASIDGSFVAAATTIPLLDMYQHATRELKKYISSGRKIIRSIEADTLADQPKLFREYFEARPDVKAVMDNQFRNGKTNARLQSKEGWYTWRSQLVTGLRDGLENIKSDLEKDHVILQQQQQLLDEIIPVLSSERRAMEHDLASVRQRLTDIESVDHELLRSGRQNLQAADQDFQEKLTLLESLQQEAREKDEALSQAAELKVEIHDQINEANRVREDNRGWPAKEVLALKARVDAVQKQTGWSLVTAEEDPEDPNEFGTALTLTYKNVLRLFFYPSAFQESVNGRRRRSGRGSRSLSEPTAPISLTYGVFQEDATTPQLSTEQRFFLQLIRSQLHAFSMMSKGSVSTRQVLDAVSHGWDLCQRVSEEIRMLEMAGVTRVSIQGDEILGIRLMLMAQNNSRIDIEFVLSVNAPQGSKLATSTAVHATAIYGPITNLLDASKTRKVQSALTKQAESKSLGDGAWITAVHGFEEWHSSQPPPESGTDKVESTPAATLITIQPLRASTPPPTRTPNVKRSPLAAKKTSTIQRKALPVPTSRPLNIKPIQIIRDLSPKKFQLPALEGKENDPASVFSGIEGGMGNGFVKPAIPPEMQEAMMHTPIKRVGALRRSPV